MIPPRLDPPAPEPSAWATLARRSFDNATAEHRAAREQAGLPTDRPVIMTGHQLTFWHAGILAKYLACAAIAGRVEGHAAWLAVDQDTTDESELRVPAIDVSGVATIRRHRLGPAPGPGIPPASRTARRAQPQPAPEPPEPPEPPESPNAPDSTIRATPAAAEGLRRLAGALDRHAAAPSAADQMAHALADLMDGIVRPAPTLFASRIARIDACRRILDTMLDHPRAAVAAYNRAVERDAGAGIAPLRVQASRVELPLWRLEPGRPRAAVWSEGEPRDGVFLAPRALTMTLLVRRYLCDLFIHGSGGWRYDQLTADWAHRWLGAELAPIAFISADAYADIPGGETTEAELAAAAWREHRAQHDPSIVGLHGLADRKRAFVRRIAEAREAGHDAAPIYREMHEMLAEYRRQANVELRRIADERHAVAGRLAGRAAAMDREIPFPLLERETIDRLRLLVERCFGCSTSELSP